MKITSINTAHVNFVNIGADRYMRLSAKDWYVFDGQEWLNCFYYEKDLEKAYQEYTLTSIPK